MVCVTPGDQVTPGIREHRIAVPLYPFFDRARGLPAVEVLEELFRKEKYDIIHTLGVSTLGPAGNFVARKLGIPSLLTVHTALKGRELPLKALNWVLPSGTVADDTHRRQQPCCWTARAHYQARGVRASQRHQSRSLARGSQHSA